MTENIRQGAGFLISGIIALTVDASILMTLTHVIGMDPFSARLIAIAIAIVAAYFAHRRLTFRVKEPASFLQFTKFAGVAATAATLNYAIYAGLLITIANFPPLAALGIASVIAMAVNFIGYRYGVFPKPEA